MTYDPSIPGPNDNLSLSQGQIQTNFSQANSLIARDHYAFNDNNNALRGHHRKVQFDVPISDPTVSGTIGTMYTKADVNDTSTKPQVFYRNTTEILQMTNRFHLAADPGYAMLAGGLILMWGSATNISSGGHFYDFPAITNYNYSGGQTQGFPNNCFSVMLNQAFTSSSSAIVVLDQTVGTYITKKRFYYRNNTSGIDLFFFAIGN